MTATILSVAVSQAAIPGPPNAAPAFREDIDWINTIKPLRLADLKGKFVLLHFWAFGNGPSVRSIAELRDLRNEFSSEIVIVGIHSGKFFAERDTSNIQAAVSRHTIDYPVCNDQQMRIWRDYDIDVRPTTVLVDPEGKIVFRFEGEQLKPAIKKELERLLPLYSRRIDRRQIIFRPTADLPRATTLNFPAGIVVDEKGEKLFIADSGNHRVIVADTGGKVTDVIASGRQGDMDGDFTHAEFREPVGLAINDTQLYISDPGSHMIRQADLPQRTVKTIAGRDNSGFSVLYPTSEHRTGLNSPLGLVFANDTLYIAMSGVNQVQMLDLKDKVLRPIAGRGIEGIQDGTPSHSLFAQPLAVTLVDDNVYVVDAASSAVRKIGLRANGEVTTLLGQGFFKFGDTEGSLSESLLQHPSGLAYFNGHLAIADSFNNKIKLINLNDQTCVTLAGNGQTGSADGDFPIASFSNPSSLAYAPGKLYVADTNNHQIRILDLNKKSVSTLKLEWSKFLSDHPSFEIPQSTMRDKSSADSQEVAGVLKWPKPVSNNIRNLQFTMHLAHGCQFVPAPESWLRLRDQRGRLISECQLKTPAQTCPVTKKILTSKAFVEFDLYYQQQPQDSLIYHKRFILELPLVNSTRRQDIPLEFSPVLIEATPEDSGT